MVALAIKQASPTDFDFWIGTWEGRWRARGHAAAGRAVNTVTKILGGAVVHEQFTASPPETLEGVSLSVFVSDPGCWKQTWVDNTGGYLDFVGGPDAAGGLDLRRRASLPNGAQHTQRMVWLDIEETRFSWAWQRSSDGDATWETLWAIDYTRHHDSKGTT
jgi:hypothetical protein